MSAVEITGGDNKTGPVVFELRGVAVMLNADVAAAFGVETRELNQSVARNPRKFGADHSFALTPRKPTSGSHGR